MSKITYISPLTISGINAISELSNLESQLKHLPPIDFHFLLFSALYQSGTDFIQLDINQLPISIKNNPFWEKKFVQTDDRAFSNSIIKAESLLNKHFDFELDKKYLSRQDINLLNYFTSLFYSAKTGIPFVNTEFAESRNLDFLESRFSKELFLSLKNLYKLILPDTVTTIAPQYSVLKKDIKRFEELTDTKLYRGYSDSLNLLSQTNKIENIKKDIHVSALKLYNKFGNGLDIKAMTFGFLKFNKKILDIFINKTSSILGDYILDSIENATSNKKKLSFYKVDEAHYVIMFAKRMEDLRLHAGQDVVKIFLDEHNKNNR